jgi:hypothetical protein
MGSVEKQNPKKLYEPPVLTVYGGVHQLTQSVAPHGHNDNGRAPRVGTTAL